jgi:hypothetical protein
MMNCVVMTLAAAIAMIATSAVAQYPGGLGGAAGAGGTHGGRGGGQAAQNSNKARDQRGADGSLSVGAPVQVQLDRLEDELKLGPQQRAAWNAYADKVLRFADDMKRSRFVARTAAQSAQGIAPQLLDQIADGSRNRLTAIEEIVDSGKALYVLLTPEQKAIADRKLALPMLPLEIAMPAPFVGDTGHGAGRSLGP